jgi:hypothetical protein
MNQSDLTSQWSEKEMKLFHDAELIEDSRVYFKELELEWQ